MKTHGTNPSERSSTRILIATVLAVIGLMAVLAVGVYVVAHLNEVVGFVLYPRLAYGGWG